MSKVSKNNNPLSQLISASELAKLLGINKSQVHYYVYAVKLIEPITSIGKTCLFDRDKTLNTIKTILRLKGDGKTLSEIRKILVKK